MNRWKIPAWMEQEVAPRDQDCVYCRAPFTRGSSAAQRGRPSWEHIINDASIVTRENIALCCVSCNASKGSKVLAVWLQSRYCRNRGITPQTVAKVVQVALARFAAESAGDAQRHAHHRSDEGVKS